MAARGTVAGASRNERGPPWSNADATYSTTSRVRWLPTTCHTHLDTVTGSDVGNRTFECRETGIRWTDQTWGRDGSPRLRRSLDR